MHPNLTTFFPDEIEKIKKVYRAHPQIFFLDDFPLIYPLLKQVDIYLGDYSSMGYDFLYFNRPLFFLSHKPTLLQRCGLSLKENDFSALYSTIQKECDKQQSSLDQIRRQTYHLAFGPRKSIPTLKKEIEEALHAH